MKFARFSRLLLQISPFGSRNDFHSNFYSTKAMPSRRSMVSWEDSTTELFRRISPVGGRNISIVPILDQWVEEGRSVDEQGLKDIINELRSCKRYNHALQISMWIDDRYFKLTSLDAATRLELISKAQGIEQAEKYFNNVPQELKGFLVYDALLNGFATAKCVEKAEAIMQKMNDLGFTINTIQYNVMLNLYFKTGNMEKLDALLQEMEVNGIAHDKYTLGILLSAYASVKDIEKMDKIVTAMKVVCDWHIYTVAAAGYRKAGVLDKAFEMLKKAETYVQTKGYLAYNNLLTQYATIGRKDEVERIWSLYKKKYKVYNQGYKCVLKSLVILGDIEMAEEIFDEWELQGLIYDMYVPNVMIWAYSKKGMFEKAEALLDRAMSKRGKPNAWTWQHFAEGYLQNEQPRKAIEMMKKAVVISETGWKPDMALFKACLEYLKQVGDTEQTEEFENLLQVKDRNIISLD